MVRSELTACEMFSEDPEMKRSPHASPDRFISSYHDRHQAGRNPLYYSERQEQRREPSHWTLLGSRVASQDYSAWMEQEAAGLSSLPFPFILDRHPQHHQDVGAYQPLEARDREWAHRASREYERGFPREGWPRRWETCNPARYGREVSIKRNDSSYRELEAWAARYSHSLQRRRRIEAELRGASQGPAESSRAPERDTRAGTTMLQQVIHPGLCKQQAQPLDTGHPPREKTCHQRRVFSQPPGYVAPPPYDTPQESSSVSQQGDTSWEQERQKQAYWSHPILKKQDIAVDYRRRKTEGLTKADASQHSFCSQYSKPEADSLQGSRAGHVPHVQFQGMLSLQQSQILPTSSNKAADASSKIIEGRKFKLNKKAGGVTIFCLVSRSADTTQVPAVPACFPQAKLKITEEGGAPKGLSEPDISPTQKLADEVDYKMPEIPESQSEPSNTGDGGAKREAASCSKTEKPETDVQKERAVGMPSGKSPSVRYPLWREPSFPVRSEHAGSPTGLKAKSGEGESGLLCDKGVSAEIQCGVRTEDVQGEAGGAEGLLGADATCVVVKMEQIPSPKKEHVHYLDASPNLEPSEDIQSVLCQGRIQSDHKPDQGGNADQNTKLELLPNTEKPKMEPDSEILDKVEPERRTVSDPRASSSASGTEALAERAERILGITLNESMAEQQPGETGGEDRTEHEDSQNQLELEQCALLPDDKGGQDSAEPQEDGSTSEHPKTHIRALDDNNKQETEVDSDEGAHEQSERESSTVEENASSPRLSASTDSWPSPSLHCQSPVVLPPPVSSASNPGSISEDPESEWTDHGLMAPANVSPSQQLASAPPQDPQSTTSSENQSQLVCSVLDLGEVDKPLWLTKVERSKGFKDISKDESEEVLSQQQEEVREQAEDNGRREIHLDNEQRAEKEEVLVDSGVEETETPAEVSQKHIQDEDNVYTQESPRSAEQLCEDTEEEQTEHTEMLEESNIVHARLQPTGTYTDDMEPLKVVETGLWEGKTCENTNQLIPSREITTLQLCDAENAFVIKEPSDGESEGATGDPTSLPRQEMGKEISSEIHTDSEKQLELEPSNCPSPPPPGFELLPTSELPAPSAVPAVSGTEVVALVKLDPEAAVTTETDISPPHLGSCEESQKSSSSDSLSGLPTSSSPPQPPKGNESAASESPLSEEPQYPQSLREAVSRIRKHTAPDSENEEEELGEVWDPENVGEDSGKPHEAQDTMEHPFISEEALTDESGNDADDVEEGPSSRSSTSSHSSGDEVTDEEEGDTHTSPEAGTEFRTLKDEELRSAADRSCVAEEEDEDQDDQLAKNACLR